MTATADGGGAADLFDAATAVTRVGDGAYTASLSEDYSVLGNPNGGYLLAVVARAATAHLASLGADQPHCLAASAAFARAPTCGPVEIAVRVHRVGRTIGHVEATVTQDGHVAAGALLSCGRLKVDAEARYERGCDVVLPPIESCERRPSEGLPGVSIAIMDRVELLLDPATTGFVRGEASDDAEIRGWLRLADGRAMDPFGLLFCLDVLPPATFPIGSSGWVPTIQLSAYVRALPADGWLVARQRARAVDGGLVDEVCELWDSRGRAVGQATQLAMVRF